MISVVMGSQSDRDVMLEASKILSELDIPHEVKIVSAHRTPLLMFEYAQQVKSRGIQVIIAGAGGAAHLPGMVASLTSIPVIGVPIQSTLLNGWDSILSILQMPYGVPVATVALNGAKNAALLAVQMLAITDEKLYDRLESLKKGNYEDSTRTLSGI